MQEGHTKSRSLAVAMQSLQRQQAQKQWGLPFHQHGKQCQQAEHAASPPGSAGKHQCGLSREQVQRRRPMTASSILQNRTGRPASILATPGSASGRCAVLPPCKCAYCFDCLYVFEPLLGLPALICCTCMRHDLPMTQHRSQQVPQHCHCTCRSTAKSMKSDSMTCHWSTITISGCNDCNLEAIAGKCG